METKFNFKSQICTSKVQSERLLALGLKKETRDAILKKYTHNDKYCYKPVFEDIDDRLIDCNDLYPAWSLDRLKELYKCVGDTSLWNLDDVNYDRLIPCIGLAIKHNSFNKEYLV